MREVEIRNMSIPIFSKETGEELGNMSIRFFPQLQTVVSPDKSLKGKLSKKELDSLSRQIFENVYKWVRTMEIG